MQDGSGAAMVLMLMLAVIADQDRTITQINAAAWVDYFFVFALVGCWEAGDIAFVLGVDKGVGRWWSCE